jgi:hypothetical protein
MDSVDQQVNEKFAEFEEKRDPASVYEALGLIEAAEAPMPLADTAARKVAVSRRLGFFAALDKYIDPTWDSTDVPVQGVLAPMPHGMVYGSGEVDPETIPDPALRAQYVEDLKANKDENRRFFVQSQLRSIDERAMRFFERLLADRYRDSDADRTEFEELLGAAQLSDARKAQLRALV